MRAQDFVIEGVDVTQELLNTAKRNGGNLDDYFVRLTDIDKLGYSAKQAIGRSPDVDHPDFHIDYIGRGIGRPAQWFYPLRYYLKNKEALFAADKPYVWLVRLKPDAWLQPVDVKTKQIVQAPAGKQRVGIMRQSQVPAAIFFRPGFEVVDRWYDYAKMHKRNPVQESADTYLYHATYGPLLKSIKANGLGNTTQSQWTDSQPGVVYLARDPEVARSYAEAAESVPEEWLDDIVVLQISQADLDPKLLHVDRNVQDNAGDTLEYHAVIPAKLLRRTK